ncbi:unnamed protein product [Rotaria sordida]|uniref:SET domain-containing protein n=1 Tax=Rotaria sordida TaxID=392033 RepID=A0A814M8K1_9BILA|nr:unnamed protein product [Rotaria sordida]CAF3926576.1 unnamed protein product [Rotaria sordida]
MVSLLDYDQINNLGELITIHPSTIYHRHIDLLLLPSIRNRFLLTQKDNLIIHGRDPGLSRSIYSPCHSRYPIYDKTWLSHNIHMHKNPLTLSHYINHFPKNGLSNVTYYKYDFYFNENQYDLHRCVPTIRYAEIDDDDNIKGMPSTILVSLRPIKKDEELFSCYLNLIQQEKKMRS